MSGNVINEMKDSRNIFKRNLKECKNNKEKEIAISIQEKFQSKSMNSFWKEVRVKKGGKFSTSIINGNTSPNKISEDFTLKFLPAKDNDDSNLQEANFNDLLNEKWETNIKQNLTISNYTLSKLISSLNNKNGPDDIHPKLLKKAHPLLLDNLSVLMNCCYSHSILPKDILKGEITPIIKDNKGDKTDINNYRPIMQSSALLKLFELHLLGFLEEKICIDPRQFGFKKGMSTTDATFLLKETIGSSISKKDKVYALFVDLSKAFDRINHFILLEKLLKHNIEPDIVKIIQSYLTNQTARVKWENTYGNYNNIKEGVRQGGILSPFLFNFYINDVIKQLTELNKGCKFGFIPLNILAYADDIVLIANNISILNDLFKEFNKLITDLKLNINEKKSKVMIFSKKKNDSNSKSINLDSSSFEVVEFFKYLGHVLSFDLSDHLDILNKLNNFHASFFSILRNFHNVNLETFIFLFKSYCSPVYGVSLWMSSGIFNKPSFKSFKTAYHNSIKKILNVPKSTSSHDAAEACNILLLQHGVAWLQLKYIKSLLKKNNLIININEQYIKSGILYQHINKIFNNIYNIDAFNNDIDAILSRIWYVQGHEPRYNPITF